VAMAVQNDKLGPSSRSDIASFIAMDVMRQANEREAAGENILHLEVGQPSTSAPKSVLDAAQAALSSNKIGYTDAHGIQVLRDRLARHYLDYYGVEVDPRRIIITAGSSGAFVMSFLAAFDVGDRIALAEPGYPAYRNILKAFGLEPVPLMADAETGYQPSPDLLEPVAEGLKGLLVASPANPTGTMLTTDALRTLIAWCADRGTWFISDEIYHGITYGRRADTALSFSDDAIVINSFSKYFSMTGWRLGWAIVPEVLVRPMERLAQNLFISPPTLSQHAALAAFDGLDELNGHVARYQVNRDLLLEELPKAGFDRFAPADGAFYLYADVRELTQDSGAFCRRILAETGVALTPGTDFDLERGHTSLRISYAGSTQELKEAVRRLKAWRP
jgi:aspartate/methionine/tyrosine aminotransferase